MTTRELVDVLGELLPFVTGMTKSSYPWPTPWAVAKGVPVSAARVVFCPLLIWAPAPTVSVALVVRFVVALAMGMPIRPRAYDCALALPTIGPAVPAPNVGSSPAVMVTLPYAVRFVPEPSVTFWFDVTLVSAEAE